MAAAGAMWRRRLPDGGARDVLHRVMRPTSHHCIHMVIKIARIWLVFFVVVDSIAARNQIAK